MSENIDNELIGFYPRYGKIMDKNTIQGLRLAAAQQYSQLLLIVNNLFLIPIYFMKL